MIGGEATAFIEALEFYSKKQLLYKLHRIKDNAAALAPLDKQIVTEMVSSCITEVTYCDEKELMRFKRYLDFRNKKRKEKIKNNETGKDVCDS